MKCIFFINPGSGAGAGEKLAEEIELFQLPPAVSRQVVFTDPARLHAQVHSCASCKDLVIICGGDGTINRVISHLLHLDPLPAVAFIPLGTGNDIARSTGWYDSWEKLGLNGLYYSMRKARTGSLDIWELTFSGKGHKKEYVFAGYAGLGCDGRICTEFMNLNNFLGGLSLPPPARRLFYFPPGLKILFHDFMGRTRIEFLMDTCSSGGIYSQSRTASQILFLNISSYAGGTLVMRASNFSDGRLECLLFKSCLGYLFRILISRFMGSRNMPFHARGSCFRFKIFKDAYFQLDGEPYGIVAGGSEALIQHKRVIAVLKPLKDDLSRSLLSAEEIKGYGRAHASPAAKPVIT